MGTLRRWDREGRLRPLGRSEGGPRRYARANILALLGDERGMGEKTAAVYTRVSRGKQVEAGNLERQRLRRMEYAAVNGYGMDQGVVGLDLNPHGVAVAHVGRDGNPKAWPEGLAERLQGEAELSLHKYDGEVQVGVAPGRVWLHAPEMWQAGADRRAYLVGVVAKLAVGAALKAGKPLAREDLDFAKKHDTNRGFNRYSSNFPYSELAEAIDRRAGRCGVSVVLMDPAHTSVEGRWRFAEALGWSVHEAAALCIGRKALGQARRFPQRVRTHIGQVCQTMGAEAQRWKVEAKRLAATERGSPAEGRARTMTANCKRIGTMLGSERILRSNAIGERDLTALRGRAFERWRKRRGARDGPWWALVMRQRVRWGRALLAGSAENP